MGDQRAAVGRFGEEVARRFLEGQGFAILETNWPCREPRGEIDIIAREPGGDLVIVEVKTRRTLGAGEPVDGVTGEKLLKLRRLAARWLQVHPQGRPPGVRFDVIGVLIGHGEAPTLVHHIRAVV